MKNVKYCRSSLLVLVSLLILVELNRRQIEVTVLQKPDICQFIIVVICERMIYSCTFLSTRKGWLAFLRYFFLETWLVFRTVRFHLIWNKEAFINAKQDINCIVTACSINPLTPKSD